MNELIFLGTAGDSVVRAKQLRSSAGMVLNIEGFQFLIDPGEGTIMKLKELGINIMRTTAVLVSHDHIGHSNDLNAVIDALTVGGLDTNGYLISTNKVINGSESEKSILLNYYKNALIKYMVVEPRQRVSLDNVEIKATRTKHTTETVGFRIQTPKMTLSYAADTEFTQNIAEQYVGTDVLVLNVVNPGPVKTKGNLNSEDAIKFIDIVKPRLTVITHFGIDMLRQNPLSEARLIERKTRSQIIAAKDGLRIQLNDYYPRNYQERLNNY